MRKFNLIIFVLAISVPNFSSAYVKRFSKVHFKSPIYLGDAEASALNKQLLSQKFSDETFNVVFKCDKYKRTPSSKSKSVNCIAMTVMPTPE